MQTKIKSFEDACEALKLNPKTCLPDVSQLPDKHKKAITAHVMLVIIAEALNEGWEPDWTNRKEWKYYPWFDMSSGSGLSYYDYDDRYSFSDFGSRLCYKTSELAEYAGTQFKSLYHDSYIISNNTAQ